MYIKCYVILNCLIVFFSQGCDNLRLSDHLLRAVLNLLRREVSEHGRHLQQYFNLFVMYANLGKDSRTLALSCHSTSAAQCAFSGPFGTFTKGVPVD